MTLDQEHMIEWVSASKDAHDTCVVRQFFNHRSRKIYPALFGKALLKVLLARKIMSRNIFQRINAIGLEKLSVRKLAENKYAEYEARGEIPTLRDEEYAEYLSTKKQKLMFH